MFRKMNINKLSQDELNYEFSVRGLETWTVDEMRKTLTKARKLEKAENS